MAGSELQFTKFDFVTGGQEIKTAFFCGIPTFLAVILSVILTSYVFVFIISGDYFFNV